MLQRRVQVFSSDPTLVSYLAHYLRARSCNIREEEGMLYLRSSYFEKLPILPTSANAAQHTDGLGAVLNLINPAFDKLSTPLRVEVCIRVLLLVLNGVFKLKYKDYHGLARFRNTSSEAGETGIDYEVDASGQRVYTALHDLKLRVVIGNGNTFFRAADKQKPSTKKIWNISFRPLEPAEMDRTRDWIE